VRLFTTVAGLRRALELARFGPTATVDLRSPNSSAVVGLKRVSLVPTMGALHAGHQSLIRRARAETDLVVVSIFVNPLQFGPNEDFHRYPRALEQDLQMCAETGVDLVFAPSVEELYGSEDALVRSDLTQVIPPASMVQDLCGRSRPGHFEGVVTVVTKLFNLVQPDRAYFGQKDAQQLAILKRLGADLNHPLEIIGCPIVRDVDGLALSSRNQYLTPEQRHQAPVIYRSLQRAKTAFLQGQHQREELLRLVQDELTAGPDLQVDYIELVHPETLAPLQEVEEAGLLAIAVRLGQTRLIDNVVLQNRKPILAIDGPAGAGKSTVVRRVARELNLLYLDTGAMYRAVTWLVLESGTDLDNEAAIAELVSQCTIQLASGTTDGQDLSAAPCRVWVNQREVTQEIRSLAVTEHVSAIAAQPAVRRELVNQQRHYGRKGGIVIDGRDIGTYVFPDAELKIFLTASIQERARRRQQDLEQQGTSVDLAVLEQAIYERDRQDSSRAIAPLRKAEDAVEVQTDGLTIEEVTAKIVALYRERLS
jgi:pantoate ligase/cytidylate kinase